MENKDEHIIQLFHDHISQKEFPCIAAKAALAHNHIRCMVAGHLACPRSDEQILQFIYDFVDEYRAEGSMYHTAAIIFNQEGEMPEDLFEMFFWQRLQCLSDKDAALYPYDKRVSSHPAHDDFSFSLKSEAFFIIGLNPSSGRKARRFPYPVMVFNPHAQFEQLRKDDRYETMKSVVRKRDKIFSGSVNPMLHNFGEKSEAFQYSGIQHGDNWQCPLNIKHGTTEHHSAPQRS